MALHRARTARARNVFTAPAVIGVALALMLVTGVSALGAARGGCLLLAAEQGLGLVMLTLSLAGLFGCAAFGTSFTAPDGKPRGGSMRPIAVRLNAAPKRRPPRS